MTRVRSGARSRVRVRSKDQGLGQEQGPGLGSGARARVRGKGVSSKDVRRKIVYGRDVRVVYGSTLGNSAPPVSL